MNQAEKLPDPNTTPLAQFDLSDPRLYEQDAWRPYFARLRAEDPVHYQSDSPFGPFWSVTRFEDIMAVEANHEVFSSEPTIVIGDLTEDGSTQARFTTACGAASGGAAKPGADGITDPLASGRDSGPSASGRNL